MVRLEYLFDIGIIYVQVECIAMKESIFKINDTE